MRNTYLNDEFSPSENALNYLLSLLGSTEFWLGVLIAVFFRLLVIMLKKKGVRD